MVFSLQLFLFAFIGGFIFSINLSHSDECSDRKKCQDKMITQFNFGVVLQNDHFSIYRSAFLGSSGLKELKSYLQKHDLPYPKTIIYMNKEGYKKSFLGGGIPFAIEEYQNQEEYGFKFHHSFDYQQRTYLDGNNPYIPTEDIDSKKLLNNQAKELFGVQQDYQKDGGVDAFLRIMELILNRDNQPILFHCLGGLHRTGMIGLALRYIQAGDWVKGKKRKIYIMPKFRSLELNPAQYEYAQYNNMLFRSDNIDFIEKFSKDERFLKLKELYGEELRANNHPLFATGIPTGRNQDLDNNQNSEEFITVYEDQNPTGD